MKRVLLVIIALLLCSTSAFAEATFDQIQGLIKSHDYSAAIQGLQIIIQNHPKSAKAYYAMSQAQAGVGNQVKAKEALDMATGIDPALKFASSGNVEKLKDAIQPQTKKIEAIESHTLRNYLLFLLIAGAVAFFILRKKKGDGPAQIKEPQYKPDPPRSPAQRQVSQATHDAISTAQVMHSERPAFRARPVYTPPPAYTPPAPVHHTTVVHNSGSSDLVTGMVLGSMMSDRHERHTVVEREYIPVKEEVMESPAPSRSSSWDDDKSSSSSSWDSGSSSSSSSWDSGGSSSSSWDSGSSDSSSSSSWDD